MVPDIILTDIQGNERSLYQSLDEGKVVIVEVFATWCDMCWEINKNDVLQRIYNTYGPNGTQQLEIFYIEGDSETGLESLFGEDSYGDWTENISYPIFNPSELSADFLSTYAPNGLPTSNVICPQSKDIIADIYQNSLPEIIDIIQNCNTISDVKDAQIIKPSDSELAICQPSNLTFSILNTGTETINTLMIDATFEDGTIFNQVHHELVLEPGLSYPVNLGEVKLPSYIEFKNLDLNIKSPDDVPSNNTESIIIKHAVSVSNILLLKITSDSWMEEDSTRWWIENSSGGIAVPISYLPNNEIVEVEIPLEFNDCFTFIVADNYGDGFLLGKIELTNEEGLVIYDETNFKFRGEASFEFSGGLVSSSTILDPSDGYNLSLESNLIHYDLKAHITLPILQNVILNVIDLNGRTLISNTITPSNTKLTSAIFAQNLDEGIYFLQLVTDHGILTRKFIKQ